MYARQCERIYQRCMHAKQARLNSNDMMTHLKITAEMI